MRRVFFFIGCVLLARFVYRRRDNHGDSSGPAERVDAATGGKYDSRKFKFVDRINYAEMRDFVVFIDEVPAEKPKPPTEAVQVTTKKITQRGAMSSPHVLPVPVLARKRLFRMMRWC